MIFHENRLLADDSHVISYLIFVKKLGKMSQKLSSATVVTGALMVKNGKRGITVYSVYWLHHSSCLWSFSDRIAMLD